MAAVIDPELNLSFERGKKDEGPVPPMVKHIMMFTLLLAVGGLTIGTLAYIEADDDSSDDGPKFSDGSDGTGVFSVLEAESITCSATVSIPEGAHVGDEFEMSVNSGGGWLGESEGGTKLGFRQRRRDTSTGKFLVPRSVRPFVVDGKVSFNGVMVDPGLMSLDDLKSYMFEVVDLPPHINDPFDDTRRFDAAGDLCECEVEKACDCKMLQDDLFIDHSSTLTDYTNEYYCTALRPAAGEEGYEGAVKSIEFHETLYDAFDQNLLANEYEVVAGQPGFRIQNHEVEAVFVLEGKKQRNFEVLPGRAAEVWGWRGGKVEDFEFDDEGNLVGGFIVVGPHPATDVNDRVVFGEKRFGPFGHHYNPPHDSNVLAEDDSPWSDLEVRSPGPELRFVDGRNTRIYVYNRMEDDHEEKIGVHWHGFDLPHDQDGVPFETQTPIHVNTTYVYEFQTPNVGSRWYHQHYNTPVTVGMGMFGPSTSEYPDAITSWDREYITMISDAFNRFTMNGNVYPGTIERLSGYFKDVMRIEASEPAADGSGDTILTIVDEMRAELEFDVENVPQVSPNPADGAPIRPGTGGVDASGNHVNRGHNIPNRIASQGRRVQIEGHTEPGLNYPLATLNGHHWVTAAGDAANLQLRVPRVGGNGTPGGTGGVVYVWRKHKSSMEDPTLQNNGCSGAHFKFNFGEEVMMRFINGATTPHPLHIHGHQWNIIAVDGNLLDSPIVHNVYMIPQAGTFDAKICCNNPNRFGGWMFHCHNLNHLTNGDNPYPGGASYPGGMLSHLDYTGFDRKKAAVSDHFHTVHLKELPPSCDAMKDVTIGRDVMGWFAPEETTFLTLTGDFDYGMNTVINEPFGNVTGASWRVKHTPMVPVVGGGGGGGDDDMMAMSAGVEPVLEHPDMAMTRAFSAEANGDYVFELAVEGKNSLRSEEDETTECLDEVTVTVTEDVVDNRNHPAVTMYANPANVRLVPGDNIGHITYPLFRGSLKEADPLVVTGAPTVTVESASGDGSMETIDVNGEYMAVDVLGEDSMVYTRADGIKVARVMRDPKITLHGKPVDVDVVPGERGSIDFKLFKARLAPEDGSERDVYFTVTDASDLEVAEALGAIFAPTLDEALENTVEWATVPDMSLGSMRETSWTFHVDPGFTSRFDPDNPSETIGPVGNELYSPMKRFEYNGRNVTINAPLIKWGDEPGQMFVVDEGGCSPLFRNNLPSPVWMGGGPPGCFDDEAPLDRYKGGQALNIDLEGMSVTMKMHRGNLRDNSIVPYYSVFEASRPPPAGYMGVIHAPRLTNLGRGFDTITAAGVVSKKLNGAVATLRQFANGHGKPNGGPNRFQSGIVPFTPTSGTYTPMWHIAWLMYNCGWIETGSGAKKRFDDIVSADESWWAEGRNVEMGDMPQPGSGIEGWDPMDPATFDPFQMSYNVKNNECSGFVSRHVKSESGVLFLNDWVDLIAEGHMIMTDSPPGAELGGSQPPLVVNCPMPITVDMSKETPEMGLFLHDEPTFAWRIVREEDNKILFAHHEKREEILEPPTDGWMRYDSMDAEEGMSMGVVDMGATEREVFFTVTDSSSEAFAKLTGATFAPMLAKTPSAAVELGARFNLPLDFDMSTDRDLFGVATFNHDPGFMTRIVDDELMFPLPNDEYSPMKRFVWNGEMVTIAAPMLKWGAGDGQMVRVDSGGCDPNFFALEGTNPDPLGLNGGGPIGCRETDHPLDRYVASGLLRYDEEAMEITAKLIRATTNVRHVFNYVVNFDSSDLNGHLVNGGVLAPKLNNMGRAMSTVTHDGVVKHPVTDALGRSRNSANGALLTPDTVPSPGSFNLPIVAVGPDADKYTPLSHVVFLVFNCDNVVTDGNVFIDEANIGRGAVPEAGNGVPGFDPTLIPFDPYQLKSHLKLLPCMDYMRNITGDFDDPRPSDDDVDRFLLEEKVFEVERTGDELGGDTLCIGVVTVPLVVDMSAVAGPIDVPTGPVGPSRDVKIFGNDNTQTWFVTIDGEGELAVAPGTADALKDGDVGTVDVHTGDVVMFMVETANTGHGVVFAGEAVEHSGTAEDEIRAVFDLDEGASSPLTTSDDFKFLDLFGVEGFGAAVSAVGPGHTLFKGTVKPGNAGRSIVFSCFVHGTATMNGRIRVTA